MRSTWGWTYITGALDLERGALTNAGDLRRALDDLMSWPPTRRTVVPATIRRSVAASRRPRPTWKSPR